MTAYDDIAVMIDGGIGVVCLNRSKANNAVRPQTLAELCDAFDVLVSDDEVRVIVLRAEGQHFCAGADFGFLEDLTRCQATR